MDMNAETSVDQWMPQGVELRDSFLLKSGDDAYALALSTSIGMAVAPLQADGSFAALETWSWQMGDGLNALEELDIEGSLIAPRTPLEAIAGGHEGAEDQLLNWQRKLLNI